MKFSLAAVSFLLLGSPHESSVVSAFTFQSPLWSKQRQQQTSFGRPTPVVLHEQKSGFQELFGGMGKPKPRPPTTPPPSKQGDDPKRPFFLKGPPTPKKPVVTERQAPKPKPPDTPPPPLQMASTDDDSEPVAADSKVLDDFVEELSPIWNNGIQKGVDEDSIKGAAVGGFIIWFLLAQSVGIEFETFSLGVGAGVGAAYVAITPGKPGDAVRSVGDFIWQSLAEASILADKYNTVENLSTAAKKLATTTAKVIEDAREKQFIVAEEGKLAELESSVDKVLEQAEESIKGVVTDTSIPYDAAARLAYEKAGSPGDYEAFKSRYKADAVTDVIDKKQAKALAESDARIEQEEKIADTSIPYDAAARLAYEKAGNPGDYEAFKSRYEADAVTDVINKKQAKALAESDARVAQEEEIADTSIPYDAAARLAYEKAGSPGDYETFKYRYEADAITDVIGKKQAKARAEMDAKIAQEEEIAQRAEEEARLAEEEAARLAAAQEEEAQMAARLAEEEAARLAEEETRLAKEEITRLEAEEAARLVAQEEARMAEEEAARQAAAQEEEARLAAEEEARLAKEEASRLEAEEAARLVAQEETRMAKEETARQDEAEKARLKEEEKEEWVQDIFVDEEDEMNLEQMAAAARAAVDQFESSNIVDEDDEELDMDVEALLDEAFADSVEPEVEEEDDEDVDLEALGRAAREAVEKMEAMAQSPQDDEEAPMQLSQDWSKLKVAELKAELKSRGLKATGKKADLVAALEEADSVGAGAEEEFALQDPDLDAEEPDFEALAQAAREAAALYNDPELMENMEAGDMEEETEQTDFDSMTVPQLKEELKARGLKVSGRKADLIQRLKES